MKIIDLYTDNGIDFLTEGHKHTRPGWVNVACPFCEGNAGYHLGYEIENNKFYCWRCGWHSPVESIAGILNITKKEAKKVIVEYAGIVKYSNISKPILEKKKLKFPSLVSELTKAHKIYLKKRNFNSEILIKKWGIKGTGPIAMLDNVSYKHRILIPIYWNNELVTFQTRDITGKSTVKYLACMKEREKIHHKHILYGNQQKWGDIGIIVEGVFDVWALGDNAAATLGIEYTTQQVKAIAAHFKKVFICYDPEPQAIKQAKKLAARLSFIGVEAKQVTLLKDPAEMSVKERKNFVNSLIK